MTLEVTRVCYLVFSNGECVKEYETEDIDIADCVGGRALLYAQLEKAKGNTVYVEKQIHGRDWYSQGTSDYDDYDWCSNHEIIFGDYEGERKWTC